MGDDVTSAATSLTPSFTLGDFTATNQQLTSPNMPSTQDQMNNLLILAQDLEQVQSGIGTFQILSGFRTRELQQVLAEGGNPTSPGTSFHEVGRAVDIAPTTMSVNEFFARLLANDSLKNLFAEIAIKPSQNAIHLAVNVASDTRTTRILKLDDSNNYLPMEDSEIETIIAPYITDPELRTQIVQSASMGGLSFPVILGLFATAMIVMRKKK